MSRSLASFPFTADIRQQLLQCGFSRQSDVQDLTPLELSSELSVTPSVALHILKTLQSGVNASFDTNLTINQKPKSALELLEQSRNKRPIYTLCQQLDTLLGGGVHIGQLTEFCGVPGIGKTQLCIQIACDAMIPEIFGGYSGAAVYIDTEGSFIPDRVFSIAQGLSSHITTMCQHNNVQDIHDISANVTAEVIMKNIHYFRVFDYIEQLSAIRALPAFLENHPKVRIVIIDSVAFHFRRGFVDYALRARLLKKMAQKLLAIAHKYNLAVVMSNQVTTKIATSTNTTSSFAPALGTSWAHACTNRIMLYWNGNQRCARLLKSPHAKTDDIEFAVVHEGIRCVSYTKQHLTNGTKRKRDTK